MSSVRDKLAQKKSKLAQPQEPLKDHPADVNNYQEGGFFRVEVAFIGPNPYQPRKQFDPDKLAELSQSIKQKGVLQPIIIRKADAGEIFLVAGERRLRAARMAGLEKIPAILTKGNPAEIALIENLQREDLKPIEEAEALSRMIEEYGYTQEQLALVIGKAKSTLSEALSLNRLPQTIKEEVQLADIYPRRLLVEVAKQKTQEEMISLFEKVKVRNLNSDQVRAISRETVSRKQHTPVGRVLEKIQALSRTLAKLDLIAAEEVELLQLINELEKLKKTIEEITR